MTFELVRRREHPGDAPAALAATIAVLDPKNTPIQSWRDPWLRRLTEAEEKALRARIHLAERKAWAPEASEAPEARSGSPEPAAPAVQVRMARPPTPRLIGEIGALTGCPAADGQILAVQVAFRPTGQLREVKRPVGVGAERCARAATVLAALDVAPGEAPVEAERSDLLMIGFRPDDLPCVNRDRDGDGNELRVGTGSIRAPRKRRNVQPVYPQAMQDGRIQGVVVVANISAEGCVADATVLRGPNTTLEAAALAAVSLWRYEPSLLDGKPVPIVMTVTVNFRLE